MLRHRALHLVKPLVWHGFEELPCLMAGVEHHSLAVPVVASNPGIDTRCRAGLALNESSDET